MSSIAYVCDENMIEFHRLYGHDEINFWRLSTRQFSDFSTNDYLFFLVKTPNRKEKGIVGYGRLYASEQRSVKSMFKKYGPKNGYATVDDLTKAIEQANKQESFPGKCQCLYLKGVTFFEAPLYLSEFGFKLNPNLESFTYLDQKEDITSKILIEAQNVGVDLWTKQLYQKQTVNFEQERVLHEISQKLKEFSYLTETEAIKISRQLKKKKEVTQLAGNPSVFYDENSLYFPMQSTKEKDVLSILAIIMLLRPQIDKLKIENLSIYTHKEVNDKTKTLLNHQKVHLTVLQML